MVVSLTTYVGRDRGRGEYELEAEEEKKQKRKEKLCKLDRVLLFVYITMGKVRDTYESRSCLGMACDILQQCECITHAIRLLRGERWWRDRWINVDNFLQKS